MTIVLRPGTPAGATACGAICYEAFKAVCTAHDGEEVIASAAQWVASTQPPYLKKLEDWLSNGAWRKEPAQRRGKHPRGGKPNPVDEMLNAGGVRRYA